MNRKFPEKNLNRSSELEKIWEEVPADYYQKSVERNIFQRLYHVSRLHTVSAMIAESRKKEGNVLDVGCASGWLLSEIANRYPKFRFTGVDAYKKAINYGRNHYSNIQFLWGDAHRLPFPKNTFDLVLCVNVLEHVVDPEKIMGEIYKVLKTNGVVIIGMDSENFLFLSLWFLWTKMNGKVWRHAHLHKLSPHDLEMLFHKTGFLVKNKKFYNVGLDIIYLLTK